MNRTHIITESGSHYYVDVEDDRFYLSGENVASDRSASIPSYTRWEIKRPTPWPPQLGQSLTMFSKFFHEPKDHPLRIPGGGKITSLVRTIESG
jgi:hypothetical protein